MTEQSTQAQSVIEAKLTKSEAIEIMVADMLRDLRRAEHNAQEEVKRLESFTLEEVLPFLTTKGVKLYTYGQLEKDRKVNVSLEEARIDLNKAPAEFKIRVKRIVELNEQVRVIQKQVGQLTSDRQASKVQLLKTILEGSPEGREWLKQLDLLRHAAAKRLGVAPEPKLLAGKL